MDSPAGGHPARHGPAPGPPPGPHAAVLNLAAAPPISMVMTSLSAPPLAFETLSAFDLAPTLERFIGDMELLAMTLTVSLRQMPEQLDGLRDAVAAGDASGAGGAAHKLKGSALTVGALRLAACCREVEVLAQASRVDGVRALMPSLEGALDAFTQAASCHLDVG